MKKKIEMTDEGGFSSDERGLDTYDEPLLGWTSCHMMPEGQTRMLLSTAGFKPVDVNFVLILGIQTKKAPEHQISIPVIVGDF